MTDNIEAVEAGTRVAKAFAATWRDKMPESSFLIADREPSLMIRGSDAATVGEVFGRDGWTRRKSYGSHYDWIKEVDGVSVVIQSAESHDMDGTPVPPKAFPLMLQEAI